MDDWARIRQLFSTGQHSKREIGRLVGVSRGTVDRALETDRQPKYQRTALTKLQAAREIPDQELDRGVARVLSAFTLIAFFANGVTST